MAGYNFFLIVKNSNCSLTASLSHSLSDHSRKPRAQTKQRTVTKQQTHQWDAPFGVPTSVCPVHLVFPFIFNQFGRLLLQALKPYQSVNFPYQHFSVDTTKLFQKPLMLLKEQGAYNFKCCREYCT